jgi:RND family efflux transporter MFP subunit
MRAITCLALALLAAVAGGHPTGASPPPPPAGAPASPAGAPAPPGAALVAPEPVRYAPPVEATGTLRPGEQAQLAFAVAGTLERVPAARGQAVVPGAPLLLLDAAPARAQLGQAEASVAAARAQLAMAEDGVERLEAIRRDQGGVSESQLVQARAQRDLARAQLQGAEAQRDQARVALGRHTLRAPFAGVVTRIPDGAGLAVTAGVPLVTVEAVRRLVLDTSLTQEEAAGLRPGARAEVTVAATGARTADARVRLVLPSVDPGTNRVPVELDVPNGDGRFLAHAFARARLPARAEQAAFQVPAAAVVQREGAFAVWIAGPDGRARALPVAVLRQEARQAIVDPGAAGFPPGTRVVALPPLGIAEGQPLAAAAGRP